MSHRNVRFRDTEDSIGRRCLLGKVFVPKSCGSLGRSALSRSPSSRNGHLPGRYRIGIRRGESSPYPIPRHDARIGLPRNDQGWCQGGQRGSGYRIDPLVRWGLEPTVWCLIGGAWTPQKKQKIARRLLLVRISLNSPGQRASGERNPFNVGGLRLYLQVVCQQPANRNSLQSSTELFNSILYITLALSLFIWVCWQGSFRN